MGALYGGAFANLLSMRMRHESIPGTARAIGVFVMQYIHHIHL